MNTMIGVDLAKSVFQLHGTTITGEVVFRKKLTRAQFVKFMSGHEPATVVMESCGSAHFWARELQELGHRVKLIAPQYVRPFVKRQKNDAADAEAIVVAAQRPEMRFVEPKSAAQQARAVLFRARDRLVHHRTELMNVLRGVLYEHGFVFPQGTRHLERIQDMLATPESDLDPLVRDECRDLTEQIAETTERINDKTRKISAVSTKSDVTRRLQSMPGLGPMTAMAIEAFAPPMETFAKGRDFAAWLGLVPRQNSTGGKTRLGRMSKAGQKDIRRLLIIGAMARLTPRGRLGINPGSWLARMLDRKPRMLVAVALANKMARMIWAMLTKEEDYREPAQGVLA